MTSLLPTAPLHRRQGDPALGLTSDEKTQGIVGSAHLTRDHRFIDFSGCSGSGKLCRRRGAGNVRKSGVQIRQHSLWLAGPSASIQ